MSFNPSSEAGLSRRCGRGPRIPRDARCGAAGLRLTLPWGHCRTTLSAQVYRATHRETGAVVAVKKIKKNGVDLRHLEGEVQVMEQLDHPNITRLIEHEVRGGAVARPAARAELQLPTRGPTRPCPAGEQAAHVPRDGVLRWRGLSPAAEKAGSSAGGRGAGAAAPDRCVLPSSFLPPPRLTVRGSTPQWQRWHTSARAASSTGT